MLWLDDSHSDYEETTRRRRKAYKKNTLVNKIRGGILLGQDSSIIVSPTILSLAKTLFCHSLLVSGCSLSEIHEGVQDLQYAGLCDPSTVPATAATVHADTPDIQWGEPDERHQNYYLSVFIDGIEYKVCHSDFFKNCFAENGM